MLGEDELKSIVKRCNRRIGRLRSMLKTSNTFERYLIAKKLEKIEMIKKTILYILYQNEPEIAELLNLKPKK